MLDKLIVDRVLWTFGADVRLLGKLPVQCCFEIVKFSAQPSYHSSSKNLYTKQHLIPLINNIPTFVHHVIYLQSNITIKGIIVVFITYILINN